MTFYRIYRVYLSNVNHNQTGVVQASHAHFLSHNITYIEGIDTVRSGAGDLVSLDGGVGSSNFSLTVESGIGHNLGYVIYLYGHANGTASNWNWTNY